MRYQVIAAAVLQITAPFVIGATAEPSAIDWTYGSAYTHIVERHGIDNPIASLIFRHMNSSTRTWDEVYQNDIRTADGGVLTLGGAHELKKREPLPQNGPWITAFPYSSNCEGNVSFTWQPLTTADCHTYLTDGENIRMFSALASLDPFGVDACV